MPHVGKFILAYEAARHSRNPRATLLEFLQSTYPAAAVTGDWPRGSLDCEIGVASKPRKVGG